MTKTFLCNECEWNCRVSVDSKEEVSCRNFCPKGLKQVSVFVSSPLIEKENLTGTQKKISETCDEIKNLLIEKNRKYGDSAINPIRVFSKSSSVEQILVRLDDKLNRIKNRQNDEDEDVYQDLIGYLVLLKIAMNQ